MGEVLRRMEKHRNSKRALQSKLMGLPRNTLASRLVTEISWMAAVDSIERGQKSKEAKVRREDVK